MSVFMHALPPPPPPPDLRSSSRGNIRYPKSHCKASSNLANPNPSPKPVSLTSEDWAEEVSPAALNESVVFGWRRRKRAVFVVNVLGLRHLDWLQITTRPCRDTPRLDFMSRSLLNIVSSRFARSPQDDDTVTSDATKAHEGETTDDRPRTSSQTSQSGSPPVDGSDPAHAGHLRLDDESEYPPLTVHNDWTEVSCWRYWKDGQKKKQRKERKKRKGSSVFSLPSVCEAGKRFYWGWHVMWVSLSWPHPPSEPRSLCLKSCQVCTEPCIVFIY